MLGSYRVVISCLLCLFVLNVSGQTDTAVKRHKISVLAPLYLDSAFDAAGNYRYGKVLPKFIAPGLEFYQGVQLAIDSIRKQGLELDINIFDTRSGKPALQKIIDQPEFDGTEIIIAHVNMADAQWLAHLAKDRKIPFINVNFPNEAGVSDNPNYILLNSTLFTHCEGLYKFMQKNYALSPIVVFRKKGAQEDRLNFYLKEIEKTTASVPLKLKYVTLNDGFTPDEVAAHLNPAKTTIALSASLDVNFGTRLATQLSELNTGSHANILVGMPNWDAVNFSGSLYKGLEIIYSTPFYIAPSDSTAANLNRKYSKDYYVRPGEMVFRGFETTYQFSHMLVDTLEAPIQQKLVTDKYKVFYDFNIQPVINKQTGKTDYYENKKLFFVKKIDGQIKAVY
ncbi:ABC transporter substrate-binding protein [Flavitalea antarctica]